MKQPEFSLFLPLTAPVTVAHVSDLHDRSPKTVLAALEALSPDLIALTGDLFHRLDTARYALPFLRAAAGIAPTVYSLGNHEWLEEGDRERITACGAILLDNESVRVGELTVGGLSSGFGRQKQGNLKATPAPDRAFLARFAAEEGVRLLLCHHPEYYPEFIRPLPIHLTLSGHAHGGQWRIGRQGIFAPGQGLFPRYTGGLYDGGRLEVSRGLSNTAPVPRLFNPTELPVLRLLPA